MTCRRGTELAFEEKAQKFMEQWGPFSLSFNTDISSMSPDYRPWTLQLDRQDTKHGAWGGFTAEEAIDFADADLSAKSYPDPCPEVNHIQAGPIVGRPAI